jgi:nucleotide-binding universal stress UspA family protein
VAGLGAPNPIDPLHPTYQEEIQGNFDAIDQWLQQHQTTARSHDVPTEIIRQMGNPSHEISRMAKEWQADLVVMGRRGRRGIQEALLGSVSNHVVHHAPCAVMVIQGQEAK